MNNKDISKGISQLFATLTVLVKNGMTPEQYDETCHIICEHLNTYGAEHFYQRNIFEFMNYVDNVHEDDSTIEIFYPFIVNVLLKYIEKSKILDEYTNSSTSFKDAAIRFSEYTGLDVEVMADVFKYDSYLRKFIEFECKDYGTRNYKEYHPDLISDLFNW